MSDKLRDLSPVNVDFSGGEQPTAAKLTSWAQQIDRGFALLEKVIGDPFSDGHPLFSSSNTLTGGWGYNTTGVNIGAEQRHLQILSLARLIGPASVLNPRVLTNNTVTITENVLGGQNEFKTRYRPITSVSLVEILANVFTSSVAQSNVNEFGEYNVDEANGLITYIATQSGAVGTITYDVDISAAKATDTYEDATFNVLPDPNQSTKCTVTGPSAGRYTLSIPTATDQQTDWDELTTTLDSSDDPNYLQQLTLPVAWATEFTSGDEIPDGLVKIWDGTANSFLEGQTFYYVDQTSVHVSDVVTLTTGSSRYSLVVHGTDIIRLLDQLRTNFHKHEHVGDDGSKPIDHRHITGKARGSITLTEIGGGASLDIGWTRNSGATNFNEHPMYLHRNGADTSTLKNAMFGHLIMAPEEYDDGTNGWASSQKIFYDGIEGQDGANTRRISFGSDAITAPYLRGEYHGGSDGAVLVLTQGNNTNYAISSNDGIVLRADRRIVLDNTDQDTYSILLNSGRDVILEGGLGDEVITRSVPLKTEKGLYGAGGVGSGAVHIYYKTGTVDLSGSSNQGIVTNTGDLGDASYDIVGASVFVQGSGTGIWSNGQPGNDGSPIARFELELQSNQAALFIVNYDSHPGTSNFVAIVFYTI